MRMKNIFLVFFILIPAVRTLTPQSDAKLVENMNIFNVLIQVRVFNNNKAVINLKKEDFKVFENNRPQKIENFFKRTEKIGIHNISVFTSKKKHLNNPRYFVLIFRITEFSLHLSKGIDYFFDHILTPQDELLVFANEKTLLLNTPLIGKIKRKDLVIQTLKEQSKKTKSYLTKYFITLNNKYNSAIMKVSSSNFSSYALKLIDYIENYALNMKEYINRFLKPDLDKYYNFARYLQKIRREKWIINFLQTDIFPNLETVQRISRLFRRFIMELSQPETDIDFFFDYRNITKRLRRISQLLAQTKNFSENEISKLFYKIKATFHTIFFSQNTARLQKNFDRISLSNNLTFFLKRITRDTGGEIVISNDLYSALHQISKKENTFYLLSYTPSNPEGIGKIKIKLSNPGYKIIYDNNLRSDYISEYIRKRQRSDPKIMINNLKFSGKTLFCTISGYKINVNNNNENIAVKIIIKDSNYKQIYCQDKLMKTRKNLLKLSINFDWLKDGKYYFIVEARDLITRNTSMDLLESIVSKFLN